MRYRVDYKWVIDTESGGRIDFRTGKRAKHFCRLLNLKVYGKSRGVNYGGR